MKILITGGNGLFGSKFIEVLNKNDYDVYSTVHKKSIRKEKVFTLDITHSENVKNILKKISPDTIVHAAAFTNVDACEKDKNKAYNTNVQGTINLAQGAEKQNAKFVFISTDYVFNGKKGRYEEIDAADPVNYYGLTKLKGEEFVTSICSNFLIARPSVIYGAFKENFVTWVIDMLKNEKNIKIVDDQFVSPTLNTDLAEQLVALIEHDMAGVFHTAGGERISRYDLVNSIADVFGLKKSFITPIKMEDMGWLAMRPKDSSLNISKISKFKKPYKLIDSLNFLRDEIEGHK